MSEPTARIVFPFDVDNTLLDNDSIVEDLSAHLERTFGSECRRHYFEVFEALRNELGYADYLGAIQRYRAHDPEDLRVLELSSFLLNYPFEGRVYSGAREVVARCAAVGPTAILSDGDVVFQPWKVERSGLARAVGGRVLIYIHKEQMLRDVEERLPADHYVLVDDKPRILAAVKEEWGGRVTTVMPMQGHYAHEAGWRDRYPAPDVQVERIGDVARMDVARLRG